MTDQSTPDAVVIERDFDAPVDLIWQMWTEPDHFKQWYGPDGAAVPVARMDVRVGGTRLMCMEVQTPNGPRRMWFTGEYHEVVENERLVYTESMSDENGNVLSHADMGMPEDHPLTTTITVELEDHKGRTKMVLTHAGIAAGSPGAAGWAIALDKLATCLRAGTADNKALVHRLVDQLWNRGGADAIEEFFADELVDVVARHHRELLAAFSDLHVTIDDIINEGDKVAARLTITGTHDAGPFAGQLPTGKRVRYASFRFYRVAGSKVVETWAMQDRLGLLRQLGVVASPGTDVEWADHGE